MRDHIEKIIELRFQESEKAIELARNLMEERLSGFPALFIKRGDTDIQITQIMSDLKLINATVNDIKSMFIPRKEFDAQNAFLIEKINSIENRIQSVPNIIASMKIHEEKMQALELIKAEISGRIWTLGIVVTIVVFVLEFITHFVFKSHGY